MENASVEKTGESARVAVAAAGDRHGVRLSPVTNIFRILVSAGSGRFLCPIPDPVITNGSNNRQNYSGTVASAKRGGRKASARVTKSDKWF